MHFITEELWQNITERQDGESLMVSPMKPFGGRRRGPAGIVRAGEGADCNIRSIRLQKNIARRRH